MNTKCLAVCEHFMSVPNTFPRLLPSYTGEGCFETFVSFNTSLSGHFNKLVPECHIEGSEVVELDILHIIVYPVVHIINNKHFSSIMPYEPCDGQLKKNLKVNIQI